MYTARGPTDKIQNKNKTLAQSKKNLKFDFEKDILKLTYIFLQGWTNAFRKRRLSPQCSKKD